MLMFAFVLPILPTIIEPLVDVILLVLIATPLIYFRVINPYIIANKVLIDRLNKLALQDELTQLGNRRALYDHFNRFLSTNIRQQHYGVVLSIDLDKFKAINDQFGHDAGDVVLVETAKRLISIIRKEHIVFRIGGDEFIILISLLDKDKTAAFQKSTLIAERIIDSVEKPIHYGEYQFNVTVSIGIKLVAPEPRTIDMVLKEADLAMYNAKKSLGRRISIFDRS